MKKLCSFAMLACIAFFASNASADSIAIANHSFENPTLSPANSWSDANPDWGDDAGTDGDQFTELTSAAFAPGATGTFDLLNHVGIQNGSFLQQDLTTDFAPFTQYTLTVAVGNRPTQTNTTGALFEIRDTSDNVFAAGVADSSVLTGLSFADFSVQFTTGAVAPSGAIRIFLGTTPNPSPGARAHFDNIRLDGTAIPEPTTALALLSLSGLGMLIRRRQA